MAAEPEPSVGRRVLYGLLGILFIFEALFLIYTLITFFPTSTTTGMTASTTASITATATASETTSTTSDLSGNSGVTINSIKYFWWSVHMSYEIQLLVLVTVSGALGSQLYIMHKFWHYIAANRFDMHYLASYFLKPFIGALLAIVFYCIIRGGFLSFSDKDATQINPYGFAALSALAGVFTRNIMAKLKQVFEQILTSSKEDTIDSDTEQDNNTGEKKTK